MILGPLLAFAALASPQAAAAQTRPDSAPSPLVRARDLERAGDFLGAARVLESALAQQPDDAPLLVRAGVLRMRGKDAKRAEELLARATQLAPKDRDAWLALGEARYADHRMNAALEAFERASSLGDADGRAANGIGSTQFSLANRSAARPALERAAKANARLPGPRYLLGRIALDESQLEEAERWFAECLALDPNDAESSAWLGIARRRRGDAAGAEPSLRRAIALDPLHLGARLHLGQLLLASGREDEGRAEIESHGRVARGSQQLTLALDSLRIEPRSRANRVLVGDALLALDLPREALPHYREAQRGNAPPLAAFLGAFRAAVALGDAALRAQAERELGERAQGNPADEAAARDAIAAAAASRPAESRPR